MVLRSPRLVLTPLRRDDVHPLRAHWSEPAVREYLWDGRIVTTAEVRDVVAGSERLFGDHGAGLWRIEHFGSPGLVGCGGFWQFHDPPELELLLSLSPSVWGRGLAQEAAGALIDHVFDALGWPMVQASADSPNERSLRLMRGVGMHPAGERPGEFGRIEVFRVTAAEWRACRPAARR